MLCGELQAEFSNLILNNLLTTCW